MHNPCSIASIEFTYRVFLKEAEAFLYSPRSTARGVHLCGEVVEESDS